MSKYFEKTEREEWKLKDAYFDYIKDLDDLSTEQKLSRFHASLRSQQDPEIHRLLNTWKTFYRVTCQNQGSQTGGVHTTCSDIGSKRSLGDDDDDDNDSKKAKTWSTFDTVIFENQYKSSNSSIWETWESFLYDAASDDTLFFYSPLRYGVITCGEGITPHESIPLSDYRMLLIKKEAESSSLVTEFEDYINEVLDSESPRSMNIATRRLPDYSEKQTSSLFFLQDMFRIFSRDVYCPNVDLSRSEAAYNDTLIHPTLRSLASSFENDSIGFIPGEEPLRSMGKIMKENSSTYDERNCYKADGIISYKMDIFEIETLLLETSSGYDKASNTKKGFDHHKATFGLLSMLKQVADVYNMASFKTFSQMKVYFIHAFGKQMRLWSLHTPSPSIYLLTREWSIIVPVKFSKRDPEMLNYILHFYELKGKIMESVRILDQINKEHNDMKRKYRFKQVPTESLLSTIIDPVIVRLKENDDSTGMHNQLPSSQPLSSTQQSE